MRLLGLRSLFDIGVIRPDKDPALSLGIDLNPGSIGRRLGIGMAGQIEDPCIDKTVPDFGELGGADQNRLLAGLAKHFIGQLLVGDVL